MHILLANFTKMVNDGGGLSKVTCLFANEMIKRGHKVTVIHSDEKEGDFFYPISQNVEIYNLKKLSDGTLVKYPVYLKAIRELGRYVAKKYAKGTNSWFDEHYLLENLKRLLDLIKPDVIVSYQPAASKMFLCDIGTNIPVISMSHGDPADYFVNYPKLEVESLKKSAICQVLLPSYEEHIKVYLPEVKTITIGNSIPRYDFYADLAVEKEQYKIVFVGRLTKNIKRPHLLIKAFAEVVNKYPNWVVEIWGAEGRKSYYKELESLIKCLNLQDKVFLKGRTDDVPRVLKSADIYAIPSSGEGFPLALGEAMSAGLPAIGFKNCSGVNEMIQDGITGFLVDDNVKDFANGLEKLMADQKLRIFMGLKTKEQISEYEPKNIWDKWESLLIELVNSVKRCNQ